MHVRALDNTTVVVNGWVGIPSLGTIHIQISANCKIILACSCPRLHNCCGKWEGWDPVNLFNYTSRMAIVTQTDRPNSVRNRCVIEVFGGVFVLSCCFLGFSVGVGAFVIGLSHIRRYFSYIVTGQFFKSLSQI